MAKKEKKPKEDWILKTVAEHGIIFKLFASFVAATNTIAVVVLLTLVYESGILSFVPCLKYFYAAAISVAIAIGLLFIVAFLMEIDTFTPDGEEEKKKK